jgi:hypothetical protein
LNRSGCEGLIAGDDCPPPVEVGDLVAPGIASFVRPEIIETPESVLLAALVQARPVHLRPIVA